MFSSDDTAGSLSYPVIGWSYSEVGEVVEIAADAPPGTPSPGSFVWGIWGHRSEAVLPAERLIGHEVPAGVHPLAACFARVGAIALNAVLAADIHLGETVAVFGQGVLGLLATRLSTLNGAEVAAIEMSGTYQALHEAIRSVAVDARVVAAGFYQGDAVGMRLGEEFHHNRIQLVCSQIGGVPVPLASRWSQERLQRVFLTQVAPRAVDTARLVSHLVPVQRAAQAYELLDTRPAEALQVVLEFSRD